MKIFTRFTRKISIAVFAAILAGPLWGADFSATPENVKILGRTYFDGATLWTGYSASGVAFKTNSKSLEVTFAGDSTAKGQKPDGDGSIARVGVFVDGVRTANVLMTQRTQVEKIDLENVVSLGSDVASSNTGSSGTDGNSTNTGSLGGDVASSNTGSLGADWHEVKILKLSESANSICGITNLKIDDGAKISPIEAKPYKIEFIGDSITCGYGVDDENRNHHFSTQTEDATKTYAYKSAEALNADYSFVSLSGWGIISGYSGNGQKQSAQRVPTVYDRFAYSYGGRFGKKMEPPQRTMWDFSQFQPDVVVINLGTNDASYTKGDAAKCKEYEDGYVDFLKTVREKNPNAQIVCTLGLMGADLYPSIQNAVKAYSDETGDTKVTTVKLPQTQYFAADWHPAEKSHDKGAETLTKFIKDLMKW